MILLRRGDTLPTVVVVQRLLNKTLGSALTVDGTFGGDTQQAVKDFQQKKRLTQDGVVGPDTWEFLSNRQNLQILDHVDAADDYFDSPGYAGYQHDLLRVGASPIVSFHQSAGIQGVARRIMATADNGRVILLRFHGHGMAGSMSITRGRGGVEHVHADSASLFSLDWLHIQQYFGPLHSMFHILGSVELHGCNVAGEVYNRGRRVHSHGVGVGPYLLQRLSQLFGVPVTASPDSQYSHGNQILPFEGETITFCPDGCADIASWAQNKRI